MKGSIIKNNKISIKDTLGCIVGLEKLNWLITDIECYPNDKEISKILDNEYCWITGIELLQLLDKEEFQWIWGVFSAFPKEVELNEVLKYSYPYADGYSGFWKNPLTLQHPLAVSEIVAWDGTIILVITKENKIIDMLMKKYIFAQDLESYNMT